MHADAYAAVRGFPKREAAEDFHLLSKLAKVGRVVGLRGEPIALSGRESERVPFGTGRAMIQGRERTASGEAFRVYDPRCFRWLEVWLETQAELSQHPGESIAAAIARNATGTDVDAGRLLQILERMGVLAGIQKLLSRGGDTQRSLNESFDALATLKLIHAVRDEVHPDVPLQEALKQASFCSVDAQQTGAEQCRALAAIECEVNPTST